MNKRINALENQLEIQKANLNKMSSLANKKEEKLNNDISQYQKQINELKNELEQPNSTITNLTEEKENNTKKDWLKPMAEPHNVHPYLKVYQDSHWTNHLDKFPSGNYHTFSARYFS